MLSTNDITKRLFEFRQRELEREEEWKAEIKRQMLECPNSLDAMNNAISHCRRATKDEYQDWLLGYMKEGGMPTHYYSYPFGRFHIAIEDFYLYPLYGSRAMYIIVPNGIRVDYQDLGHSSLYIMDGFLAKDGFVPVYADMIL